MIAAGDHDLDIVWWSEFHGLMLPYFRGLYGTASDVCETALSRKPEDDRRDFLEAAWPLLSGHKADHCIRFALALGDTLAQSSDRVGEIYARLLAAWAYSTIKRTSELNSALVELARAAELAEQVCRDSPVGTAALRGRWLIYQFRAHVHYYLGRSADAVDDYNEAIACVNEYVGQLREHEILAASPIAGRRFIREELTVLARPIAMRGMIFFEEGDFRSAIRDLEVAHEVDPLNAYVLALKGLVEYSRSEFTAALEALDASVALVRDIGIEKEVSGRPEYLKALLLQKIQRDWDSIDSRHHPCFEAHREELEQTAEKLFGRPFDRYINTQSPLDALNCLLLSTDLSTSPTESIARTVLWELLYGVDGHDDFMSKLCTFNNWTHGMLKTL